MTAPLAALIGAHLPSLAGQEITLLGEGTDHRVYEVGGAWLLRVPRHQDAGAALEVEARVLRWLAPQLPLPLPAYEVAGPGFAAYRKLPGTPALSSSAPLALEAQSLGPRLGAFLRALHDTDAGRAATLGVPPDDDPELGDWAQTAKDDLEFAALHGLLGLDLRASLHRQLNAPPPPSPLAPVLIHGDFAAEHVLLDESGEPCAVTDWSDMILGNVAQDLGGLLHWGGPGLLREAQRSYGPVSDVTLERARFYATCRALADLVYGQERERPEYVRAGQAALGWLCP